MRDELLPYYERELRYIRRLAADFAERYPGVAGQLLIEPEKCEDPHVERLIEAFALLTARIRLKIDDEFPEVSDAFLGLVYPQLVTPMPSTTIVQLALDPEWSKEGEGLRVPPGTRMLARPVDGVRCQFRTAYPVTLWPVRVDSLEAIPLGEREEGCPPGVRGALRIRLKTFGGRSFAKVGVDELRFFLDRDPAILHRVYELMFRSPKGLLVREPAASGVAPAPPRFLEPECLVPDGFDKDQGLLPHPPGASHGHRLLLEYFCFPEKFHFAKLRGLGPLAAACVSDTLDVLVLLEEFPFELQGKLSAEQLKLGCTPAVNLFEHQADPIRLVQRDVEHRIVPDAHTPDSFEVHTVLEVESLAPRSGETREYRPFYGMRHGDDDPEDAAFWHASRRSSPREGDAGTDVHLMLVDRRHSAMDHEPGTVLNVRLLCSNRDLPSRLPLAAEGADDFRIEGLPGIARVRALRKPTRTLRPALGSEGRWKVVSHLSLNFLSLLEVGEGEDSDLSGVTTGSRALDAFREILKLYDFSDSAVTRQRIHGVVGVAARPVLRRVPVDATSIHVRGLEVTIRLDEDHYAGTGVFLFASVLEAFLAHYTSVNSFVQTVAEVKQREGALKRWPPRSGARSLL